MQVVTRIAGLSSVAETGPLIESIAIMRKIMRINVYPFLLF